MFNGIGSEPITVCMRDRRADRWGQAGGSRERVADGIVTCRQSRKWRGGGMRWGNGEQDGSETCYDVWFRGDRSWKCVTGSELEIWNHQRDSSARVVWRQDCSLDMYTGGIVRSLGKWDCEAAGEETHREDVTGEDPQTDRGGPTDRQGRTHRQTGEDLQTDRGGPTDRGGHQVQGEICCCALKGAKRSRLMMNGRVCLNLLVHLTLSQKSKSHFYLSF